MGFRIMIKTPSYVEENVFPDKNGRNPLSSMIYRFFAGTLLVRKNVLGSFVNNTF